MSVGTQDINGLRVLLTGGTGYIGSHTAVALKMAGCHVVLFDNLMNSEIEVLDRISRITGSRPAFVLGDVRNAALLKTLIHEERIDAVLHFAGSKAVGESVKQPLYYYDNNVAGTVSLVGAMQSAGLKRLVFSSSCTVYGTPRYLPVDELHPQSATNPYGRSKVFIEAILADIAAADSSWQISCLRYFNPVGAHESGLLGEIPKGIPNCLMPYIARVATGELPWVQVYGDDYPTSDGSGIRDYVHVMDVAEGHVAALRHLSFESNSGRQNLHCFNLGTGSGYSVLDMIKMFELTSGKGIPYKFLPRRPGDVAEIFGDVRKAGVILNWHASRDLVQMCESLWKFQVNYCAQR